MIKKIGILETGPANYLSIKNAIKKIGYESIIINKKNILKTEISHLILPGVGSFDGVMKNLKKKNYINYIKEFNKLKKPILGICIGYQILFEKSTEGKLNGLGFFKGQFKSLKNLLKVTPNVGWIKVKGDTRMVKNFAYKKQNFFYFSHSYYLTSYKKSDIVGYIKINNKMIPAVLINKNIFGFQFHPEKSSKAGLLFLKLFCEK
jgi:glutamine amidotransferase